MRNISNERLREVLHYDADTGVFTWKVKTANGINAGKVAGCIDNWDGYRYIGIDKVQYKEHRLAWQYVTGEVPDQIDHINHARDDNRFCNLRNVSKFENNRNSSKPSNNTSGVVGVCWDKSKKLWRARININKKSKGLGRYKSFDDACAARKRAEIEYGFHENHGK